MIAGGRSRLRTAVNVVAIWSSLAIRQQSVTPSQGCSAAGLVERREGFEPPIARSVVW